MMTPTSVLPYMPHGRRPTVCSSHSNVPESIGSPVNESFCSERAPAAVSPASRSIRYTVGAAARLVISNSASASSTRAPWNFPA